MRIWANSSPKVGRSWAILRTGQFSRSRSYSTRVGRVVAASVPKFYQNAALRGEQSVSSKWKHFTLWATILLTFRERFETVLGISVGWMLRKWRFCKLASCPATERWHWIQYGVQRWFDSGPINDSTRQDWTTTLTQSMAWLPCLHIQRKSSLSLRGNLVTWNMPQMKFGIFNMEYHEHTWKREHGHVHVLQYTIQSTLQSTVIKIAYIRLVEYNSI